MLSLSVLSSVFFIGLLGGVHCLAMCSGIAVAVEQRHAERVQVLRRVSPARIGLEIFTMHLGRITTYSISGAVMGGVGGLFWQQEWVPAQRAALVAGGLLLIIAGLALAFSLRQSAWTARLRHRALAPWAFLLRWSGQQNAVRAVNRRLSNWPLLQRFATGLAWGLLPCGLTFSALSIALLAGNAWAGGAVMLAFGLGTLPNLMAISGFSGALHWMNRYTWWRIGAGGFVIMMGAWAIYRALVLPDMLLSNGFCFV